MLNDLRDLPVTRGCHQSLAIAFLARNITRRRFVIAKFTVTC